MLVYLKCSIQEMDWHLTVSIVTLVLCVFNMWTNRKLMKELQHCSTVSEKAYFILNSKYLKYR